METVTAIGEVRERVCAWKRAGARIAFVPTMGNLHAGHISLIELARRHGERFVASIFVNPMQFGPNEDFAHYPRTPARDSEMLAAAGCDLMFMPDVAQMYGQGATPPTRVEVPEISATLCGGFRPGHFEGVATVVAKLFNIVQPDVAVKLTGKALGTHLALLSAYDDRSTSITGNGHPLFNILRNNGYVWTEEVLPEGTREIRIRKAQG